MYFKPFFSLLLGVAFSFFTAAGQKCPSGKKNKEKGTENFSVMLTSKDYYSLIMQKEISFRDSSAPPKFSLLFNVASRVKFTDSLLAVKGTIELLLATGDTVTIGNVTYANGQMGFGNSLLFRADLTEEVIGRLTTSPIETLTVKNILSTSFATKKQKEQPALFTCLLQAKTKP